MYYKNYYRYRNSSYKKKIYEHSQEKTDHEKYIECQKSQFFNHLPTLEDFGIKSSIDDVKYNYNEFLKKANDINRIIKECNNYPSYDKILSDIKQKKKAINILKLISITIPIITFIVAAIYLFYYLFLREIISDGISFWSIVVSALSFFYFMMTLFFFTSWIFICFNEFLKFVFRLKKRNEKLETLEKNKCEIETKIIYNYIQKAQFQDGYGNIIEQYNNIPKYERALKEYNYCQQMKEIEYEYQRKLKTIDFWRDLDGNEFEINVSNLFRKMGYKTKVSKIGADHGIDIIANKNGKNYVIQCKHYTSSKIQESVIRDLYGVIHAEKFDGGFLVCLNGVSSKTREYCTNKTKEIEIIDLNKILELEEKYSHQESDYSSEEKYSYENVNYNNTQYNTESIYSQIYDILIKNLRENYKKDYKENNNKASNRTGLIVFLSLVIIVIIFTIGLFVTTNDNVNIPTVSIHNWNFVDKAEDIEEVRSMADEKDIEQIKLLGKYKTDNMYWHFSSETVKNGKTRSLKTYNQKYSYVILRNKNDMILVLQQIDEIHKYKITDFSEDEFTVEMDGEEIEFEKIL